MSEQFANTKEMLEAWPLIDDEHRAALLSIISTRGKHKGFILGSCPSRKDQRRVAAWQAVMMALAPMRVSVGQLIFMDPEAKQLFDELSHGISNSPMAEALNIQEPPFRWNLFANNLDVDGSREKLFAMVARANFLKAAKDAGQQTLGV